MPIKWLPFLIWTIKWLILGFKSAAMSLFKKIILGLFLSSFIGYLEWGKESEYIATIEYGLLLSINDSPEVFLHPFILLPLLGQILLLVSLLVAKPKFNVVVLASTGIALLYLLLLFIGLLAWNPKMSLCALPFLGFYFSLILRRKKLIFEWHFFELMKQILFILASFIGLWYAKKYGREAVAKINKFNTEKENKNQTKNQ